MSIKHLHNGHPSSKRRKLDHDSENDSDFSDGSVEKTGAKSSALEKVNGTSKTTGTKGPVNKNHNDRTVRIKQAALSKPTVLPTGGINKSAILAFQLSDLFSEQTPDYNRIRPKWTRISDQLITLIKGIPQRSAVTATEASKSFRKASIRVPWPQPSPNKETNYKFEFVPPRQFVIGGALPQGLSLKHENTVNITATMPNVVLQEKDYLNNRALHKASFYLACIGEVMKEQLSADFDVAFVYLHDVDLLPVLKVVPKDAKLSNYIFRICVGFPEKSIPPEKTLPTKNCLRQLVQSADAKDNQPTPFYNSAVAYVASVQARDSLISKATKSSPSFEETCRTGQIWLRQRGFSSSVREGGFGLNEWSSICALLMERGGHQDRPLFSARYSSLQLFKAMLQLLASRDLQKQPMLLFGDVTFELPFSDAPVFYDGSTGVNLLYKMSPSSYQALRRHAQVSLAALNSKSEDSFDATFVQNVTVLPLQYDEVYSVRVPDELVATTSEESRFLCKLHAVLIRGLGDRATLVDFKVPKRSSWALNQESTSQKTDYSIKISLLVNPETVSRLVDHGPSADEAEEAAQFRQFWGDKAELRRFKDGSISESLVWAPGAGPIPLQIIQHLALQHFKFLPSTISSRSEDLESSMLGDCDSPWVSVKDAFRLINTTYQTLTSTLHNLEGLPLPIRSISPASPALRSTSTLHPLLPATTQPINILIQFDSSTRWPDSLPAIQHTKIAFLLKLAELLDATSTKNASLTTRVGLENTDSATTGHLNTSFLDVIYPSATPGLSATCFRLRIYHDRELHLLQAALQDKSLHGALRDSLALGLATHKRDFQAKVAHTLAMRNLMTKFPPLSGTVRLLKKWTDAHMLGGHILEEILEVIAAKVFLVPLPWSVPGNSTTAFLRCLHFLARWEWSSTPLTVDLSVAQDGISEAQKAEMQTRFQAWRKLDPAFNSVVWFIGTSIDLTGTVFTAPGEAKPPRVVAGRVPALAKAAMNILEDKGTDMDLKTWKTLFVGELSDYDFVIHLNPSLLPGRKSRKSSSRTLTASNGEFKNLVIADALDVQPIGFDPVDLFLKDLTHAFGASALFFHDRCGGHVIAGLWRPSVRGRKEWRVRLGWSSVLVLGGEDGGEEGEKVYCEFNRDAVLAEMVRLGDGLVKEIETKD